MGFESDFKENDQFFKPQRHASTEPPSSPVERMTTKQVE